MIVTQTPFRIGLGGGGTDIPSWYKKHGSTFLSAAIDKYMIISLHRTPFFEGIHLKYSETETVDKVEDIKHGIIRETLKRYPFIKNSIEIISHADIPAGTGLGSSGSFGVGLVKAIAASYDLNIVGMTETEFLAQAATYIQMDQLGRPIGPQDQYVAAYGGVNVYTVDTEGNVKVRSLECDLKKLEEGLVMFYTGITRDTDKVLKEETQEGLRDIQLIGEHSIRMLEAGGFRAFGTQMNHHWIAKQKRQYVDPRIKKWYKIGHDLHSTLGGKLVGAGGGGFLLFYTEDKDELIRTMPLKHMDFKFEMEGSKVLL